jgi:YYY domain-containing protein
MEPDMAFPEFFAALRWWFVLLLIGTIAFPLSFTIFRKLPDRGYAFTKMFGLLLVAYFYWMVGSLGFLGNNTGGIIVSVLIVGGFAYWLYSRSGVNEQSSAEDNESNSTNSGHQSISDWVRRNWTQILLTELVFAILFIIWIWVRSQNPAIAATEKPMEFAFLNAIGRSPSFPPLDPWLSGFAISYYYFGYVMTSLLARLALVPEQIAFNLALAWLIAGAGTGAFGLVYNFLKLQGARRSAIILGLVAAFAVPVVGNLTIGLEVAHANNIGRPEFWQWLDVRDLNNPPVPDTSPRYENSSWWWWRSSRPLHEYHLSGRPEEGLEPIAEFPGFSFVLGDVHAHVLALPFAFLSLAAALVWWLPRGSGNDEEVLTGWDDEGFVEHFQSLIQYIGMPLWLSSALILGGLAFLNTWDVLIHLFVILGAFFLARWRDDGWQSRHVTQTIFVAGLLLFPAVLLYLPFFLGFRSQAGAPYLLPMLMRPTRFVQWLIIFGMPIWALVIFLLALVGRQRFHYWQTGFLTILVLILALFAVALFFSFIVAGSPEGVGIITTLAGELGIVLAERPDQFFALGWAFSSIKSLMPTYLSARINYAALTLFLTIILGMVVMIWREILEPNGNSEEEDSRRNQAGIDVLPFILLLIATGALLTLGPEFIYLRDNFGQRINTIFKFYYQAWVMFGVSALFAIGYLWLSWRGTGRIFPVLATAGYMVAFLVALLFPIYAVNSRALEYRGPITEDGRRPATLDGLAQMAAFNPGDYAAVLWLNENVTGTPVILEAVGGQYTNFGRISAGSGLPTILGWAGHEYQWRGATPEPAIREPVVTEIYSSPNLESVATLLDSYNVRYIVVGGLERGKYGMSGMDKFSENLDVAFESNGVTIYYWTPQ